jgi:hypothetical protein
METRILWSWSLLALGLLGLFFKKYRNIAFVSFSILVLILCYKNHVYALWKGIAIFHVCFWLLLIKSLTFNKGTVVARSFLIAYTIFVVASSIGLVDSFEKLANKMSIAQLEPENHASFKDKKFTIVSPSQSQTYLKLGAVVPLNWLNSGWGPSYSKDEVARSFVALYFDCATEGRERCSVIRESPVGKNAERRLYLTNIQTSELLNQEGRVDQNKLKDFIKSSFNVVYTPRH